MRTQVSQRYLGLPATFREIRNARKQLPIPLPTGNPELISRPLAGSHIYSINLERSQRSPLILPKHDTQLHRILF